MAEYIPKSALVAEIERRINKEIQSCATDNCFGYSQGCVDSMRNVLSFIDTLEVKEVGISIPNIDDILEAGEGLEPDSKEAKIFKKSYYMALEKLKEKKGE